jgi:hypothetical protein
MIRSLQHENVLQGKGMVIRPVFAQPRDRWSNIGFLFERPLLVSTTGNIQLRKRMCALFCPVTTRIHGPVITDSKACFFFSGIFGVALTDFQRYSSLAMPR